MPGKRHSLGPISRHSASLPADEVTALLGIPVTSPPRTVLDFAAGHPVDAVESLIRQYEFLRLSDSLSLHNIGLRYPGHRGTARLRTALTRLADAPAGRPRRGLEERFLSFLHRHRLPRPELNAWVDLGSHSYEVDCLWRAQRRIVELDSWEAHGTRTAFRSDRTRDRHLQVAGYAITRLTWAQLDDEPEQIAADLRALLYERT